MQIKININYVFRDVSLLNLALTHPSLAKNKALEANSDYERLEFLGDSVLSMVISDILYHKYKNALEGQLSLMHANVVNTSSIAKVAASIDLGKSLMIDHGEEMIGGRSNPRNLENAMEAVIGAVYLDSDYDTVKEFIRELWQDLLNDPKIAHKNHKTALQEWMQKRYKKNPKYVIEAREGGPHSPIFSVSLTIPGLGTVTADGKSKKEAEQKVATLMLEKIYGE